MDRLQAIWSGLNQRQRIMLAAGSLATVVMFALVLRLATSSSMALLYANLDPAAAGQVIEQLERSGTPYEVRGDAIFVDVNARDRARIQLAQQGLPDQGPRGYEILVELSSFGTTTQMFDAAYWRAKEGELARTIQAMAGVKSVRVHLAPGKPRAFSRDKIQPSASVTLTLQSAAPLSADQAVAIRYMVALAVEGLSPAQVAVIDSANGVILRPGDDAPSIAGGTRERELGENLQRRVTDLLAARYGLDSVRVTATVDTTMESETMSERRIDPDSRVAIHTDVEESEEEAAGTNGAVTVASNVPDGDANENNGNKSQRTTTRERTNYEFSEVRREIHRNAGDVRKITVAVLLDAREGLNAEGETVFTPVPQEEIEAVEALVKSAIGFDADRGDVVTVRSMQFTAPAVAPLEEGPGLATRLIERNALALIELGVLAVVTLALGLLVVRPLLGSRGEATPQLEGFDPLEDIGDMALPDPLEGGFPEIDFEAEAEIEAHPVDALKNLIAERPEEAGRVLNRWLREPQVDEMEDAA